MAKGKQREVLRTLVLASWGMLTLVLLFTVGLLVVAIAQKQGELEALSAVPDGPFPLGADKYDARMARGVRLYFAHPDKTALKAEMRLIGLTERTVENCRRVLEALIEGPRDGLGGVLPPTTTIRGMYLLRNGELVVDFSRELEAGQVKSVAAELLMAQAVATSLCQASLRGEDERAVLSVRFLFEGSAAQDTFPVHIDLSAPVRPDNSIVDIGGEGSGDA